jgi:hypothetical protein
MKHDVIVEEIHQIRQNMLAACHGDLNQLLDQLQEAETQECGRLVSLESLQAKRQNEQHRHLTKHCT